MSSKLKLQSKPQAKNTIDLENDSLNTQSVTQTTNNKLINLPTDIIGGTINIKYKRKKYRRWNERINKSITIFVIKRLYEACSHHNNNINFN